jgi:hypothetical protein
MSSLAIELHPQAFSIEFTNETIIVELIDGRTISAPLIWFPLLSKASKEHLNNWELLGDGEGIHWPDLDEDLSVSGLLAGIH